MRSRTSAVRSVSRHNGSRNSNSSTHARRDCRRQLNLKLSPSQLEHFKAVCAARGLSMVDGFGAMLSLFAGVGTHIASYESEALTTAEQQREAATTETETPLKAVAPAEAEAMRAELAELQRAFPGMTTADRRPPNVADARNVLRHARRKVPDADPHEVAWFLRRRVLRGQAWRSWGGVVFAAGDYVRGNAVAVQPAAVGPVAYLPTFEEWRQGRAETDSGELWDRFEREMLNCVQ